MLTRRNFAWIPLLAAAALAANAQGEDFPSRPLRIVTTGGVGSTTDLVARVIAQGISGPLGQQTIVDNRNDRIAQEIVAKAPPDGYTFHVAGSGFWVEPLLHEVSYDPARDFSAITLATTSPNVLVVLPSSAAKSVKDLVVLAKSRPGVLNYGSAGAGGAAHLAGELFKTLAGVNIVHVPYKGAGAALTALIGGEVQLMFATAGAAEPHIRSAKLTALAVTSAQPSALVPGVPTVAASGFPGYEAASMVSAFAPAKTPVSRVGRLNREIVALLNKSEIKQRLFYAGVEVVGSSPEELAARMRLETAKLGKLIKDAGIRAD
jgi:tripartite-type tricarboxylate transporter receptor subunit TctC